MTSIQRPLPIADERSKAFWAASADHVLVLARCSKCRLFAHPPDLTCPHCHSSEPDFEFVPTDGGGIVRSWTLIRQSFLPGLAAEVPFLLVDVELSAQPDLRLIGRLIDGPEAQVRIGAPVSLTFEDISAGVSLPAFALGGPR